MTAEETKKNEERIAADLRLAISKGVDPVELITDIAENWEADTIPALRILAINLLRENRYLVVKYGKKTARSRLYNPKRKT